MAATAATAVMSARERVSVLDPSSPQDAERDTKALSPVGQRGLGGCQDPCVFSS